MWDLADFKPMLEESYNQYHTARFFWLLFFKMKLSTCSKVVMNRLNKCEKNLFNYQS